MSTTAGTATKKDKSDPIVSQDVKDSLAAAIKKMNEYLDEIQAYKTSTVPTLYGPYSYEYDILVSADGETGPGLQTVRNDGWGEPWAPKRGDRVPWHWVKRLHLDSYGYGMDDDVRVVNEPIRRDIPEVLTMRHDVEKKSPTLEELVDALTKEDCDTLRECFTAIQHNVDVVDLLGPSAAKGETESATMDRYIDDNWESASSEKFHQRVDDLEKSFGDLYTLLEKMATGYLALNGALMTFVTAIVEILDLRKEQTEEEWRMIVGVLIGGVTGEWADAKFWLEMALDVVDTAGEGDSEDRREAMGKFGESEIARNVTKALTASQDITWPSWGDLAVGKDFS